MKAPQSFPWFCPSCAHQAIRPVVIRYEAKVEHDGATHQFDVPQFHVPQCERCGELIITDDADRQLDRTLRAHLGLLAPEQILANRKALGLTQQELANHLRIAKETVCRWETGAIVQSAAMDTLLRVFFGCPELRTGMTQPAWGETVVT